MKTSVWEIDVMMLRSIFATGLAFLFCGSALGQVTWDTVGNGNWEDSTNWSTGAVPQPTEDVLIDQGGGFLITIGANVPAINSISSEENISVSDDVNLTIATGGTLNGEFALGTRSVLTVNGGTLTTNGATNFDGGNLVANSGATMNFSNVGSYVTDTGTNNSRTFEANGGSAFNFSNLTDLTGGTFVQTLNVEANGGSSFDMSALTNYNGGSTRFVADGAGSSIDINSLATFHNTNTNIQSSLEVKDGGTINASALTTIQSDRANKALIRIDGAASTLNAALLTDVINTRLQLTNGGTHDFSGVTSFLGSDAYADSGESLDLTGVTSYDTNGGGNNSRSFSAEGAGTKVDLSNVTSIVGGTFIRRLDIGAANGGEVDLSATNEITEAAAITADGADSLVDLSSMQTFSDSNNNRDSRIEVSNGGEVRLNTDAGSSLVFNSVDIDVNSGGVLDTSRLTEFTSGTFTTDVDQTLGITNGDSSSFIANDGAKFDVTSLSGVLDNTSPLTTFQQTIRANGAGSEVDISNVTSMTTAAGTISSTISLEALDGGEVNASGITTFDSPIGLVNSSRPINVTADGSGSRVDLSSLRIYTDVASVSSSLIQSINGGVVDFGAGDLVLTNVDMNVSNGGSILSSSIELISMEINSSGDDDDFSVLFGDGGTVFADVINTSGIVSPGLSPGTLTIDGDYVQGSDGLMDLEIQDELLFDQLLITGNAQLGGTLSLTIDDAFDLSTDMDFIVVTIGGIQTGIFSGLSQGAIVTSDNGFDLRIDYQGGDGNDIRLTTSSVTIPEPAATWLLVITAMGIASRRKRV